MTAQAPTPSVEPRRRLAHAHPSRVDALREAWKDPEAWKGMTQAGGVDLPGEVAGLIALDELVIHGWDVARALGKPYEPDEATLEALYSFVVQFAEPGQEASREGLFGPVVPVPDDAPTVRPHPRPHRPQPELVRAPMIEPA